MAASATTTRAPGRPRAFDVDQVLDHAIGVFRDRGYEATSMADIERATGLNASSIYNTFGSKAGLFDQSLSRYEAVRLAGISELLAAGTAGVSDLHSALDLQQTESMSEWGRSGCLAINTMIELGQRAGEVGEMLAEFRRKLADAIRQPVDRAVALGEISPDRAPTLVTLLVAFTLGTGVLMRSAASTAEMAAHFEAAHELVRSFTTTS